MADKKYEHLIVRKPVPVSELPHHENEPLVQYPVIMAKDIVPEADVWITQFFSPGIPEILAKNFQIIGKAVKHKHTAPEVYLVLGEQDAITAEVMLGDETYEVSSPAAVYIPAGLPHGVRPLRAEAGKAAAFVPIVLAGAYTTEDV